MTDASPPSSPRDEPTAFPGMPDDDLVLSLPSGPSPDDPAGIGSLAYSIHTEQLSTARHRQAPDVTLNGGTIELFHAALRLTGSLNVPDALHRLVDSACTITGAAWGTIGVLGAAETGAPTPTAASPASPRELDSMLAGAHAVGPAAGGVVIANDLSHVAAFTGRIEGEGTGSILSAPLRVHGRVYGRLYLCDKDGGFEDGDASIVLTLAEAAAVAVENARLYREARDREQWMAVSQELTTLLLSGAEEDDALTLIARRVREVAHADTAALVLPGVGQTWVCEIAAGAHSAELIGTSFPPKGRAMTTLAHQTGLTVDSLTEAWDARDLLVPELAVFGPALYAPMIHRGRGVGVMLLLREQGSAVFTQQDLEIAELVAGQATMAFELADAQHAEEMATLLDERARIGRDLHDLAIQQLFATGMQISAAHDRLRAGQADGPLDLASVCGALESSLEAVDESVRQIRSIVRSLRDRDEEVGVVERLRREASLARTSLGYAPSLILTVDGHGLAQIEREAEDEIIDAVDAAVEANIADDMVAVVREGLSNVARHAKASSVTVDVKIEGVLPGRSSLLAGEGPASGDAEPFHGMPVVEVVCRDDGVGVDPAVTRRSGTANMAERARRHGGTFAIGPRARSDGERRGTCFTWRVPLEPRPLS